jgi:hypothetical protein
MKHSKFLTILFFLLISSNLIAQKKDDGKLRIILINFEKSKVDDSCKILIYKGEEVIKTINLKKLIQNENIHDSLFFIHEYLSEGEYDVIIEKLFDKPVLINNLKIKSKVMNYLPIDFKELRKSNSESKTIIIKDSKVLLEESLGQLNKMKEN